MLLHSIVLLLLLCSCGPWRDEVIQQPPRPTDEYSKTAIEPGKFYSREKLTEALADKSSETIVAVDQKFKDFDAWISSQIPAAYMPSFTASFVYKNRILYQRAINADIGRQYPVVSFTKLFTATCILRLVGQKKISLDDPVSTILTGYQFGGETGMTVRNLLTHSSGFLDDGRFVSMPGTVFRYSNHNYRLLGAVVQAVSNRPAYEFMSEELVQPLAMKHTTVPASMNGAVGLYTSSLDMTRFLMLHINHGQLGEQGIYSPGLFEEIPKPAAPLPKTCNDVEYRGIGFRVVRHGESVYLMDHLALWNGIGGYTAIFPEQNTAFVYMSDPPYYQQENFFRVHQEIIARLSEIAGLIGNIDPARQSVKPCRTEDVQW